MKIIFTKQQDPWNNKYSKVGINGAIIQFIKNIDSESVLAIPHGDGLCENNQNDYNLDLDLSLGILCSRNPFSIKNNLIYLPIDDDIFQYGLNHVLKNDIKNIDLNWEDKIPICFWRGAHNRSTVIREQVVRELNDYQYSDVKFIRTPWSSSDEWDDINEYNILYDLKNIGSARPVSFEDHVKHKYILIMDGFIIASNLQWVFGSGSVPILISDENTNFWFKHLLIPFQNYIPATFKNIKNVINYLINNDEFAKNIAKNSKLFSETVFSSLFQQNYLKNELEKII